MNTARFTRTALATIGLGLATLSSAALAGPPFAEHAPDGKTLVPHEAHRGKGTMYHVLTDREQQIFFESDAPMEKIKGRSNQVIGYAVALESGSPARLVGGEWHLPVESMKTGIELRDQHLAGSNWLDAENHPHIVFQLEEVKDIELVKESAGFETYSVTLVGDMTIHGVSKRMSIPNTRVTFMEESERTRRVAEGDLVSIRTSYSVRLSDFDVSHGTIGSKVAEVVEIDTKLFLSTVPPGEQG